MPAAFVTGSWLAEHWVAVLALLFYTGILLYNAVLGRSRTNSPSDYYVGGRRLGGVVVGLSFFATFASTNSYIGHAGKGYAYGLPWLIMVPIMVLFTYLSWRFVAPRMRAYTRAWDCLTLPDFIVARFAGVGPAQHAANARRLRLACALVILFSSLLYLVAVFKGAGNLFQMFLNVQYESAVAITLVVVVAYTSIGGFHSVVRTDVVQGSLMVLGAISIFYCVTQAAGGVGSLLSLSQDADTAHLFTANGGLPFVVLLGVAFAGSLKLLVDPRQLSRFYGLRDERSVRQGLWVALVGIAVVQGCLFPIGLYAHHLLEGVTDTDLVIPLLINDPAVFPLWLADLLIVAIVAAAMSSMDSVLLVAASVLFNDVVAPVKPTATALRWTKALVVLVAVVGAVLALNPPGGIVEMTVFAGSLYAVCFVPAILLGLHWRQGSAQAVLGSLLAGVLVLVAWLVSGASQQLHEVFPALLVSLAVYLVFALRDPATIQQWPDTQQPESHAGY